MKKKDPFSKRKEPPRISKNWIHLSEDLIGLVCFSRLLLWLEAKNSVIIFVKIENQSKIRFQKRKIYDVLISRFAVLRYQFSNMTEKITKTILSKMTLFHRVLNSRWQISHHLIVKTIDNRKRLKKGYKNALKSSNYLNMDRKWFKCEPKMVKSLKIGLKKYPKDNQKWIEMDQKWPQIQKYHLHWNEFNSENLCLKYFWAVAFWILQIYPIIRSRAIIK